MSKFINEFSAPCLLGPRAKNVQINNGIFSWMVGVKNHFSIFDNKLLTNTDLQFLAKFENCNFHYISEDNLQELKKQFIVSKEKNISVILNIESIYFPGKKGRRFRNYLNRYPNLSIENNYRSIDDVKIMLNEWSSTMGSKYFRDFSGKNMYFLNNNYHIECSNVFIYHNDKLVSFGCASPIKENHCVYIIGKALCKAYPGLSELTDLKLYEKILSSNGPFKINMGRATKGLIFYKEKFPNSSEEIHYNGSIKIR